MLCKYIHTYILLCVHLGVEKREDATKVQKVITCIHTYIFIHKYIDIEREREREREREKFTHVMADSQVLLHNCCCVYMSRSAR